MTTRDEILGSWHLARFDITSPDGQVHPWGKNVHGLLIYAASGHMSVSINKDIEPTEDGEATDTLDSILFYSGQYSVEGDLIHHRVTEASNPKRVGKEMIRYANLRDGLLELLTPVESFGQATLVWKRADT